MDKKTNPSLFVNDGSFMERFKQQQEKEKKSEVLGKSGSGSSISLTSTPKTLVAKSTTAFKISGSPRISQAPSSGKLAFSLKQKSKLAAPAVKFNDEDEDEKDAGQVKRQNMSQLDVSNSSLVHVDVAPHPPSDSTVKEVADRLALFVAKNGRQLEHMTRQKNPGNTPFKFLYDESCSDYKYYQYRISEEEKALSKTKDSITSNSGTINPTMGTSQKLHDPNSKFQTQASALYDDAEYRGSIHAPSQTSRKFGESNGPAGPDPLKMMEYYMKKAAREEKLRPHKASKDEMPPPASLQGLPKKGHHMGDYIPQEELEKFMATCNDVHAQKAAQESAERNQIQADNVGHRLLSKMGWKEGEGLGSSRNGIAAPIMAGDVKKDTLGVGAHAPGEVTSEDDIYEQYKKRMMLGYKHRPNPLNNPRKSYY